jgi:3-hydroxybutyryl-CoA dehydrogenase
VTPAAVPGEGIQTVGVVGAGTMGAGIAQSFAQAGFRVLLHDADPGAIDRARRAAGESLAKFVDKGTVTVADRDAAIGRIVPAAAFDALAPAGFVVEAIVEHEARKCAVFAAADRLVQPGVILASNTSSIPVARLAGATSRPDRVVGMHFMNPVPLMPLVEIVRGTATSDDTVQTTMAICRRLGKTPVESADRPGFIANRILMPMINEAVHALMDGVGSVEAIDAVMTLGMRHPMGPLALADLIGLDVCAAIMDVMAAGLGESKYAPAPLLRQMVADGRLGRKAGRGFYEYADRAI